MTIVRNILGENVEITLTDDELTMAYEEFVREWVREEMKENGITAINNEVFDEKVEEIKMAIVGAVCSCIY